MMRRPLAGRVVDRTRPVRFTFGGRAYQGLRGDTLASALLANGVDVVAPSPILGRPRGIFSAGPEEPNAFVELTEPWFDAIAPATTVELVEGLVARPLAGVGRLPGPDVPIRRTEHEHRHVEVLVVGAGLAGLRVALEAADGERRVLVVDERHWVGGTVTASDAVGSTLAPDWAEAVAARLRGIPEVQVRTRTTALGVYDDGYAVIHERGGGVDRLLHVRAERVVLATGAIERPIAFAGNDRPRVMLASAAWTYADRFGVVPGSRIVVLTTNHAGHEVAMSLAGSGTAEVVAVVDVDPEPGPATERARTAGLNVRSGWTIAGTEGAPALQAVHLQGPDSERETVEADLLLVSGGWNPNLTLWRGVGGGLRHDDERSCFIPNGNGPPWLEVVGAAAGDVPASRAFPFVPADDLSTHFVDLQRDQTVADVLAAVDRGLRSTEHVKRATYIGTAVDQGRTSGVLTAQIVSAALGEATGAQGPSSARPPAAPVAYAALAGRDRGWLLDPARVTPIHPWHVEHGAVFENVGQWRRPWYFERAGVPMDLTVTRECIAVRTGVGVMDASTLGKIEVVGPDAGAFLDRMYTNAMSTLAVGSIRYGLMLGLDGMVFDDGVAMRLAENRYLVTTTTGGAARVLDHFEEWLQTEWPELRVYCTSVTEQWAVAALNGPLSRDVLVAAGTEFDLSARAFPFMTWRDATVAGIPARLARVSFSGELAFEVHVDGRRGLELWEALIRAGAIFGIAPYGTEAMHVLRAEKGYVIVGQDTDGTVTPHDLGMSWIVNETKGDFAGRRSLQRSDTIRAGRKQLVGLLPVDPRALLPEGAQLVLEDTGSIPTKMAGHVTSSYRSPIRGRTFALAMLEGGADIHGQTVFAPLPDRTIPAMVTAPVFHDPEGARRDG
jgi:sarcosine oxidase subunit alpha